MPIWLKPCPLPAAQLVENRVWAEGCSAKTMSSTVDSNISDVSSDGWEDLDTVEDTKLPFDLRWRALSSLKLRHLHNAVVHPPAGLKA